MLHQSLLFAPSWRTIVGVRDDLRAKGFAASAEPPMLSELRGAQVRHAVGSGGLRVHVVVRGLRAGAGQGDADCQCGQAASASTTRACGGSSALRLARGGGAGFVAGAAHRRRRNLGAARPRLCQPVRRHGAAQSHLRGRRQGRRDGEGIRGFPRGARRQARGGHRRQHRHGAAFEAGIKANFENAEITFDKFHVIKLANEAVFRKRFM